MPRVFPSSLWRAASSAVGRPKGVRVGIAHARFFLPVVAGPVGEGEGRQRRPPLGVEHARRARAGCGPVRLPRPWWSTTRPSAAPSFGPPHGPATRGQAARNETEGGRMQAGSATPLRRRLLRSWCMSTWSRRTNTGSMCRSRPFHHRRYELIATGEVFARPRRGHGLLRRSREAFPDQRNEITVAPPRRRRGIVEFDLLGTHLGRVPRGARPRAGVPLRRWRAFLRVDDDRIRASASTSTRPRSRAADRRGRRPRMSVAVLLALATLGVVGDRSRPPLREARLHRRDQPARDYTYVLRRSCFCVPSGPGSRS